MLGLGLGMRIGEIIRDRVEVVSRVRVGAKNRVRVRVRVRDKGKGRVSVSVGVRVQDRVMVVRRIRVRSVWDKSQGLGFRFEYGTSLALMPA